MHPVSSRKSYSRRLLVIACSLLSGAVFVSVAYCLWLFTAPLHICPLHVTAEIVSPITPVKQQGRTQLCWAYAMLAAIETEHFRQGDSLNLPIEPVLEALESNADVPQSHRAMGQTLLNLIRNHGIYEGVCNPGDYMSLCTMRRKPYGQWIVPELPDNWENNRFFNLHPDTLLNIVAQAVHNHRGVCWEGDISERGFSFKQGIAITLLPPFLLRCKAFLRPPTDDHCMAIVGVVRSDDGTPYFVMKNSWGTANPYGGLMLMSFDYFRWNTVAVCLPNTAWSHDTVSLLKLPVQCVAVQ